MVSQREYIISFFIHSPPPAATRPFLVRISAQRRSFEELVRIHSEFLSRK